MFFFFHGVPCPRCISLVGFTIFSIKLWFFCVFFLRHKHLGSLTNCKYLSMVSTKKTLLVPFSRVLSLSKLCMHVCTYARMHYARTRVCTYARMYVCTHAVYSRMHICTYARMHYARMHVCKKHVCTYARMHVCTYARMHYAHTHVCTYACMHVCILHVRAYARMHV